MFIKIFLLFLICVGLGFRDKSQNYFGNPEFSGLGFSGFRITETSGIGIFGIQDYAYENLKNPPSKVAHDRPISFFQYCQPAKTSRNHSLCSIKIAHRMTYDFVSTVSDSG